MSCKDQVGLYNRRKEICLMSMNALVLLEDQSMTTLCGFHKLGNGHEVTQLNIPNSSDEHQVCQNLPAYWGKFVTNVKQKHGYLNHPPYVSDLYFHLKAYEPHAKKTLKKQVSLQSIVDPLAYVAHHTTLHFSTHHQPARNPQLKTHDTVLLVTLLLTVPEEGSQASCKEHQKRWTLSYSKDKSLLMEAKEKGDVLDAEAEAFPPNHEDALTQTWMKALMLLSLSWPTCITRGNNNPINEEQALVIQRNKRNAELVQENDLLKVTLSGKEKSIAFLQSEKEKILSEKKDLADSYLDEIDNDLHKDILGTRNPGLGYMAKRAQPVLYDADTLLHPNHHPVSIWDSEEVLVHQVVSMKKMNEKPGHVRPANDFYAKLNALMFVPQKELSGDQAYWLSANEIASQASKSATPGTPFVRKSRPPSQVLASLRKVNAVFPQLEVERQQLQGKDATIRNLDAQINIMKVLNVGSVEGSVDKQALDTECIQLVAFTAENTKLKAQVTGTTSSGPSTSETPKVLAPGMYNLGVKPTSGASKTVPKRAPRNHSSLPVEMNNVCGACNKSLVFANHTDCLVMCDGSVNVKPHQTKRFKRQPRKEWKPVKRIWKPISKPVANSKPQWKPTGRHFSLFEKHPLTRIMESTDMPIELPPSASSSPKITMVVQIVLWYLDSGCSRHMTGDRARLINFVEKFIGTVRFGNDEYAAIIGYGDYKLGDTIISRVYYVEGLKHNLFSVMDVPTIHVSTKENLEDPIDIRVDIIHPEPVAAVAFLAAVVVRTQAQHGEAIRGILEHLQGVPIEEEMSTTLRPHPHPEQERCGLELEEKLGLE
ncbi:hypothetical protein Tco_0557269 [Tanacetum coccineum]